MGNQINNFTNKSQQLAHYHTLRTHQSTGIIQLKNKYNGALYLMRTITTNSQQKCQSMKDITMKKVGIKQVPITQLQQAFLQQDADYCGRTYKINLIFEISDTTLEKDIAVRKNNNRRYSKQELLSLVQNIILALHFYKQSGQMHQSISSTNVYFQKSEFVLADPLISQTKLIEYNSPQKIAMMRNTMNIEESFDQFVSNLFSLGILIMQAYYLQSMIDLYKGRQFNKFLMQQRIKDIDNQQIQKIVKDLTGPPRLRSQAVSEFKFVPNKSQSEIKINKKIQTRNKKQLKKEMQRQIIQAKQQVKKIIQTNSIRQMVYPYPLKSNLQKSIQKLIEKQTSISFLKPNTILKLPEQIRNQNSPNILKNHVIMQSPKPQKMVFHRHSRSNSQQIFIADNDMKPSTASTVILHRRELSNGNLHQSLEDKTYKQIDCLQIKQKPLLNKNLLKQRNGILNTSVSSHGFGQYVNMNSFSLKQDTHPFYQQVNNSGHSYHINQLSSVIQGSAIDNLSMVFHQSQVSNRSNSSNQSLKSGQSNKSRFQNTNSNKHNSSIFSAQFKQPQIRTIVNRYDPLQDSLLYSKSVSRQKIQPSEGSIEIPTFIKISDKSSENSSLIESQSQLLASQSNKSFKSNKSVKSNQYQSSNNKYSIDSINFSKNNTSNPNQYTYQGQYKNKVREGEGKLFSSTGKLVYDGQWKQGMYHGYGKVINQSFVIQPPDFKNLDLNRRNWIDYQGNFKNNIKQGFGKIVFVNGQSFQGQFINDMISGFGQYFRYTGKVIDGIWFKGKINKQI